MLSDLMQLPRGHVPCNKWALVARVAGVVRESMSYHGRRSLGRKGTMGTFVRTVLAVPLKMSNVARLRCEFVVALRARESFCLHFCLGLPQSQVFRFDLGDHCFLIFRNASGDNTTALGVDLRCPLTLLNVILLVSGHVRFDTLVATLIAHNVVLVLHVRLQLGSRPPSHCTQLACERWLRTWFVQFIHVIEHAA